MECSRINCGTRTKPGEKSCSNNADKMPGGFFCVGRTHYEGGHGASTALPNVTVSKVA